MQIRTLIAAFALGLLACGVALAQQAPARDPIAEALFPPDLVISHQQMLGLSDSQKTTIQTTVQTSQAHFTQVQWQLADAVEGLAAMLKQPRVDQSQVLTQLDKVLGFEREIKRTQLTMMIRIKNALTPEQQARLRQLKDSEPKP